MSSDKQCCVPGCTDSRGTHQVLHGFPNLAEDKDRFNTWLYAIGGDILGMENEQIYKYRRVCNLHFEEKYMCRNNKISKVAVPTLHMPARISQKSSSFDRKPMQPILNLTEPSKSSGVNSSIKIWRKRQFFTKPEMDMNCLST